MHRGSSAQEHGLFGASQNSLRTPFKMSTARMRPSDAARYGPSPVSGTVRDRFCLVIDLPGLALILKGVS